MKDKLFYTKCLSIYSSYYSYTNDNQLLKLAMNMNSSNVIGIDRSFKAYFQKTYSMRPDNLNRSINRLTSSSCIAKINETDYIINPLLTTRVIDQLDKEALFKQWFKITGQSLYQIYLNNCQTFTDFTIYDYESLILKIAIVMDNNNIVKLNPNNRKYIQTKCLISKGRLSTIIKKLIASCYLVQLNRYDYMINPSLITRVLNSGHDKQLFSDWHKLTGQELYLDFMLKEYSDLIDININDKVIITTKDKDMKRLGAIYQTTLSVERSYKTKTMLVKHVCGHTSEIDYVPHRKTITINEAKESFCPKCEKNVMSKHVKKIIKNAEKHNEKVRKMVDSDNWPILTGSTWQVREAILIRKKLIDQRYANINDLCNKTEASWWINHIDHDGWFGSEKQIEWAKKIKKSYEDRGIHKYSGNYSATFWINKGFRSKRK